MGCSDCKNDCCLTRGPCGCDCHRSCSCFYCDAANLLIRNPFALSSSSTLSLSKTPPLGISSQISKKTPKFRSVSSTIRGGVSRRTQKNDTFCMIDTVSVQYLPNNQIDHSGGSMSLKNGVKTLTRKLSFSKADTYIGIMGSKVRAPILATTFANEPDPPSSNRSTTSSTSSRGKIDYSNLSKEQILALFNKSPIEEIVSDQNHHSVFDVSTDDFQDYPLPRPKTSSSFHLVETIPSKNSLQPKSNRKLSFTFSKFCNSLGFKTKKSSSHPISGIPIKTHPIC
ncbi:hypothetical protein AYI68_g292 [Smittium mucronatum]|uniref:Uncharacterized protein n=1 Tax=Smittium mucronatum TaxID=133383 RepID=A0A1R0H8T7_9FUNG|nr:hypothetical protein AYI68_g292 [Smittium mucronatum]